MRKKSLKQRIEDLEDKINCMTTREDILYTEKVLDCYMDNIRIRDWLLKTNFIGNLKDDNIIKLLKTQPFGIELDYKSGYYNPAFQINKRETFADKLNKISTATFSASLYDESYSIYNNTCEEIRCYEFKNIQKLYDRIVDLEKLERFLDKYRPLKNDTKAKSADKKIAVAIKQNSKKGETKNEN